MIYEVGFAMRATLVVFAVLMSAASAPAQTVTVDRVEVSTYGIYGIDQGAVTLVPDTPTGQITAVDAVRNLERTRIIKARVGLEFGFEYTVFGQPAGVKVTLDIVHRYPNQGLRSPDAAEPIVESRYQRMKVIGEAQYLGYGFEHEWEMEPGTWKFEIWYEGRLLAEESFTIEP